MFQRFAWGTLYGIAFMLVNSLVLFAVLDKLPDPLGWIKIGAGLAANFGGGIFVYMRDPEQAWKIGPGAAKVGVVLLCIFLSSCAPMLGGMNATESIEIMKAQNARGCVYVRGSATPWASAGFTLIGTWGSDPPSYAECWKGLPVIP